MIPDEELKARLRRPAALIRMVEGKPDHYRQPVQVPTRVMGLITRPFCAVSGPSAIREEDFRMLTLPMAVNGEEAIGSMGTDTLLACLSDAPAAVPLFQATVRAGHESAYRPGSAKNWRMSLTSYIGTERNILTRPRNTATR